MKWKGHNFHGHAFHSDVDLWHERQMHQGLTSS